MLRLLPVMVIKKKKYSSFCERFLWFGLAFRTVYFYTFFFRWQTYLLFSKQNIILDNFLCCLVFMDGRVGNWICGQGNIRCSNSAAFWGIYLIIWRVLTSSFSGAAISICFLINIGPMICIFSCLSFWLWLLASTVAFALVLIVFAWAEFREREETEELLRLNNFDGCIRRQTACGNLVKN